MKYIRTKYGVYDTSKGIYTPSIKMWAIGIATIYDEDILKQTDTIEELCDEFVVVNLKYNIHHFYDKTKSDWTLQTYACSPTHIVYGCIWTDKGLIFVAKMNADGVLCLI